MTTAADEISNIKTEFSSITSLINDLLQQQPQSIWLPWNCKMPVASHQILEKRYRNVKH